MEYIYGNPDTTHSWKNVASIFAAHDSLNSVQTSSLPLVQFWRPSGEKSEGKRMSKNAIDLLRKCFKKSYNGEEYQRAQLCFEYAVPVYTNSGRGKASMTDLMILTEKHTIAVEAKWTECDTDCQMIDNWLETKLEKGDSIANRKKVLKGWIQYVNEYLSNTDRTIDGISLKKDGYLKIPYQLLHRIASACAVAKERKTDAIVIYQLFHNVKNNGDMKKKITKDMVQAFADKLNEGYAKLFGKENPIRFCIVRAEVEPCDNWKELVTAVRSETGRGKCNWNALFLEMQKNPIYTFSDIELFPFD